MNLNMSWRYWQSNNNEKWRPQHQPESAARVNMSLFLNVKHICLWEHCSWASWDSKGRMSFPAGWTWGSRGSELHLFHLMLLPFVTFVSSSHRKRPTRSKRLHCIYNVALALSQQGQTALSKLFTQLSWQKNPPKTETEVAPIQPALGCQIILSSLQLH